MAELETGTRIAGRYSLENRLDSGGRAQVWAATDDELQRKVAVKILVTPAGGDPAFKLTDSIPNRPAELPEGGAVPGQPMSAQCFHREVEDLGSLKIRQKLLFDIFHDARVPENVRNRDRLSMGYL